MERDASQEPDREREGEYKGAHNPDEERDGKEGDEAAEVEPMPREDTGHDSAEPTGMGAEAIPADEQRRIGEHESGYGGKPERPRLSSDQRPLT